jgi:hypothetical protein
MEPRFQLRKEQMLAGCRVPPTLFLGVTGRLESFAQPFVASLPNPESRTHSRTYLAGLLSDVAHKNAESIACRHDLDRQVIQRFIGEVGRDHGSLIEELARQVGRSIGRPDAEALTKISGVASGSPSTSRRRRGSACGSSSGGFPPAWDLGSIDPVLRRS